MGGTSTDISLVYDGEMRITNEWSVEYGHPICFPASRSSRSAPAAARSPGSTRPGRCATARSRRAPIPGPACYQRGGEEPTNTDANVVLGRLGGGLVGGAMTLDRDAPRSERSRSGVGEPLGLDVDEAADAIMQVANANMADAVRLISIRRGYDPRDFALVAFGGAGALHGAALARSWASRPSSSRPTPASPRPSAACSWTCATISRRCTCATPTTPTRRRSKRSSRTLEDGGARAAAPRRACRRTACTCSASIAMRYLGQWRSLSVADLDGAGATCRAVGAVPRASTSASSPTRDGRAPVEIYQLALRRGRHHAQARADPARARARRGAARTR